MKEKNNQNLMQLIRKVHGLVENTDMERQRQSQDSVGSIYSATKDLAITEIDIDGMHAEWISVQRMHAKRNVILYCHGGGYMTGSCLYARTLTSKLTENTSMDVLCFDYRLAPEHQYPCASEDAMKAWDYLMLLGYGARDVIVAGDSAGGNMALSLVLKLKQQNRRLPKALVLLSPWTDMTNSGKTHQTRADIDPVLNAEYMQKAVSYYLGEQTDALENPLVSPLYGDFKNFPPTYIQVGDNEILLSDSLSLHKKMLKENVNVKIDVFKGMWHVFQMSPFKTANKAMEQCADFILKQL